MREWLGSVGVMFLMAGLVGAAEGTISKVDLEKKTVTVPTESALQCTFRSRSRLPSRKAVGKRIAVRLLETIPPWAE
jgi:hypothetical protein